MFLVWVKEEVVGKGMFRRWNRDETVLERGSLFVMF